MTDDAEIDRVYITINSLLCAGNDAEVDRLLAAMDPLVLPAEVIVAWLIATLAVDHLPSRPDFIARARPVLDREPEGADAVLAGLVPCWQCGAPVPADRAGYSWPMCLACLPAPSEAQS